jgi:hypothetical protein
VRVYGCVQGKDNVVCAGGEAVTCVQGESEVKCAKGESRINGKHPGV